MESISRVIQNGIHDCSSVSIGYKTTFCVESDEGTLLSHVTLKQ